MNGNYHVDISQRAQDNLVEILYYLDLNWSEKIKTEFLKRFIKQINHIKQNPYLFPIAEYGKDARRCMITKHNALYYRNINDAVEIITIHNLRQNPDNFHIKQ